MGNSHLQFATLFFCDVSVALRRRKEPEAGAGRGVVAEGEALLGRGEARMKLSTQAYCKLVLDGAKYPHCAVNGLPGGPRSPRRGRPRPPPALFVDFVPLYHGSRRLPPMMESRPLPWIFGLRLPPFLTASGDFLLNTGEQIDSWCKENSYVIAGYYQANERIKDASPNQVAEKVASRIAEGFSDTALIMVDNTKFTMECILPAVHVYEHHENKWRCKDPHYDYCEDWSEAQRISASLLDSRSYETLVDFDNHLDDIRNDWTNPEINKAVLHLC
nr:PREDICTED: ER membrane protein complex subunit 8 [Anolis carolinensis]|eukprot:XP_016852723.1 PREDICTED: ER membrane protein complex subunit 8 [Anolis carolinensis]